MALTTTAMAKLMRRFVRILLRTAVSIHFEVLSRIATHCVALKCVWDMGSAATVTIITTLSSFAIFTIC